MLTRFAKSNVGPAFFGQIEIDPCRGNVDQTVAVIQREIVVSVPESYRILLYRRMMLRIAERIAYREHAHGLVTGDSISQVASQTLRNMEAVGSAATLPIYRPLVGDDKQEILDLARRIGEGRMVYATAGPDPPA